MRESKKGYDGSPTPEHKQANGNSFGDQFYDVAKKFKEGTSATTVGQQYDISPAIVLHIYKFVYGELFSKDRSL